MQMKNLMVVAGAVTFLAASSFAAFAEEATGTIESVDSATGMVTLDDGKIFKMPTSIALATFKAGQKVKITFEGQGTPLSASAIALVPTADGATPAPGAAPSGGSAGPINNPGAPRD
jgi:hypothetical protein